MFDTIKQFTLDPKDQDASMKDTTPFSLTSRSNPDDKNKKKVFKCPLTGDIVESSNVRKVYFC